ncbi:prohibitin-2a [Paralichthys olivaceus]|uniref:prohibitin-2a n=1 Tax=Paralichthys olivaceus TaxID=8255 RepID=UPI0037521C70
MTHLARPPLSGVLQKKKKKKIMKMKLMKKMKKMMKKKKLMKKMKKMMKKKKLMKKMKKKMKSEEPGDPIIYDIRARPRKISSLTGSKAQQEAQRAQFCVEKAKQDQRPKIIQAEGEAQAAKRSLLFALRRAGKEQLGEAVTKNPGYLKLGKIRAAQNIAKTVALSQNKVCLVLNLQERDQFECLSLPK